MWTKNQIDKLGNELKAHQLTAEKLTRLNEYRVSFLPAYEHTVARLKSLNYEVTGRPAKSTGALIDKLERQHVRLSQVQDIAGCRVVVDDIYLQQLALAAMQVYLDDVVIYDRRVIPSHGYRAIHVVASHRSRKVEVQLRTELQHLWAEISEKMSDIVDPRLKYGGGDATALSFLNKLSQSISKVENEEMARMLLMTTLRNHNLNIDKKAKKKIRQHEKSFFQHRSQLLQLLKDVRNDFDERLPI